MCWYAKSDLGFGFFSSTSVQWDFRKWNECGVGLSFTLQYISYSQESPCLHSLWQPDTPQTEQESPHLQDLRVSLFSPASGNALEHRHSLSILRIQFWNLLLLLFITKYYMISFTVEGILFKFLFFHSLLLVYKSYWCFWFFFIWIP